MDETIQFYAGATLPLLFEFRDPNDKAIAYPLTGATATVINNTTGQVPNVTLTNAAMGDVRVLFMGAQTALMTKRQRGSFQLKVDLNDGVNTIILRPTEVMPL